MDCSPPGCSVHGILQAGLPFPSLGDLPDPGIEPRSPALQTDSLLTELQGKSVILIYESKTKKGQLIILSFFIM